MHEDDFEVQFCDLCGTSVPLSDLESGAAMRHHGKTIGACCLGVLREGDSPLAIKGNAAVAGGGADGKASTPAAAGGGSRARSEGAMLLPVAIALLAGMAGTAIYLDLKIQGVADRQKSDYESVTAGLATSRKTLDAIDQSMDGGARKSDVDDVRERVLALDNAVKAQQEQNRQKAETLRVALDGMQKNIRRLDAAQIDYRPLFDDLRQQMQRTNRAIADLQTGAIAPVGVGGDEPGEPAVGDVPADAVAKVDPGVPEDLAAQIKRLADGDAAVRFEAVDHLLVSKNVAVLPYLLPMAQDTDGFVRRLVVEGLRDFRHADSVEALLAALSDEDPTVAETAWSSLKRLTGQKISFDATAPSKDARLRAQQRWRDWWEKNKTTFGT
ncbi:MAG: HEAT repeat domain-containing protein [bacterium]|nr:HEAT repeat domain-containing protein [bacterium]